MINDRIAEGYRRVWLIRGIGSRRVGINPLTFSKAYWSAVISKVLYGVELCDSRRDSMKMLDDFHIQIAKKIQGLPTSTANIVPLSAVKWMRLATEVTKRCMLFHWQIYSLPVHTLYKQLLVYRIVDILRRPSENKSGPSTRFVECCKMVGLLTKLRECVYNGDVISKKEWKSEVYKRLNSIENNEWKASVLMTSVASEYKQSVTSYTNGFHWWTVAKWNNKMLPRVKRILKYMVMNVKECIGITCGCCERITLTHMMFECEKIKEYRTNEWSSLERKMPEQMRVDVESMPTEEKSMFLLSCMNGKPVKEWQNVYESIVIFCDNVIQQWCNVNSCDEIEVVNGRDTGTWSHV